MVRLEHGVEVLDTAECRRRLERGGLGRVVVCDGELPIVRPMNYRVIGGDIVVFTAADSRLAVLADGRPMVFEVDAVDGDQESGWSIVAVGPATLGGPALRDRAEALGLYAWAAGVRHCLVRIRPERVTGREISPGRRPVHRDES